MSNHNQSLLVGILLGSLVGAAAVLLYTPVSGERARKTILNGFSAKTPTHKKAAVKRKKAASTKKH